MAVARERCLSISRPSNIVFRFVAVARERCLSISRPSNIVFRFVAWERCRVGPSNKDSPFLLCVCGYVCVREYWYLGIWLVQFIVVFGKLVRAPTLVSY